MYQHYHISNYTPSNQWLRYIPSELDSLDVTCWEYHLSDNRPIVSFDFFRYIIYLLKRLSNNRLTRSQGTHRLKYKYGITNLLQLLPIKQHAYLHMTAVDIKGWLCLQSLQMYVLELYVTFHRTPWLKLYSTIYMYYAKYSQSLNQRS